MSVDHRRIIESITSSSDSSDADTGNRRSRERRVLVGEVHSACPLSNVLQWGISAPCVYSFDAACDEQEVVCLGACETIVANDKNMFERVKERLFGPAISPYLKWYGIFAFDPAVPQTGIWRDMPQAVWFVPKLQLIKTSESTIQVIYVDEDGVEIADVEAGVHEWLKDCQQDAKEIPLSPAHRPHEEDVIDDESSFSEMVDVALQQIHEGHLHKVVLARQSPESVRRPIAKALARLSETYPQSHVFAFHWQGRWLLGASPERLVRADAGAIQVDCLAGSTRRGETADEDDDMADELLCSVKDRAEHQAVVDFVTDRLKLVADDISFSSEPSVKKLANVQHLHTPVAGTLKSGRTIVDTVELLHPTPAVGGVPRAQALEFIRQHEHGTRGFYAGGFGFVDGLGNGLFSVALRTAAVHYPDARLYAGCGIVDGSNGADEWRETELKLQPMRMALT